MTEKLLLAVANGVPTWFRKRLSLVGYETDPAAIKQAFAKLSGSGVQEVVLRKQDFLSLDGIGIPLNCGQLDLFEANPPSRSNNTTL